MKLLTRRVAVAGMGLAAVFSLAACGGSGSSSAAQSSSAGSPAAAASGSSTAPSGSGAAPLGAGGPGGGGFGTLLQNSAAVACLKAAGITLPSGGARPSGSFTGQRPTNRPSGAPTGARPSGAPSGGGAFGADAAKIQAALKACGITLPAAGNGGGAPAASG